MEIAKELNLPVNDLYSVLIDHPEVCKDGVHQTEKGNMMMAEKIVEEIKKYI